MSRFKLGLALGLGIGYVLGTKAGRERYLQLQRNMRRASELWQKASSSSLAQKAAHKAGEALGDERDQIVNCMIHRQCSSRPGKRMCDTKPDRRKNSQEIGSVTRSETAAAESAGRTAIQSAPSREGSGRLSAARTFVSKSSDASGTGSR